MIRLNSTSVTFRAVAISVTEFSKQTGDYASLSAVDLRVLALTYQLEKEYVGTEHIRTKADRQVVWDLVFIMMLMI